MINVIYYPIPAQLNANQTFTGTNTFTFVSTGALQVDGDSGFYGTSPIAKPTVTGSKSGNAALASLMTALADLGLVTDSTT
jgi:hypothetical protein